VADVEVWVVPHILNPLLFLLSSTAGPSVPTCGPGGLSLGGDRSPASADKGACMAGCMLNITSFKSCQLLQEQRRRQSFEVNPCYCLSKKTELLVHGLGLHLVNSRQPKAGSCGSGYALTRISKEKCTSQILSTFCPSRFM